MFCPNCGKQVPDGAKFCTECGSPLTAMPAGEQPQPQQLQQQPQPQQPPQFRPPQPMPAPAAKRNVPALVLGIIGSVFAFFGAILWVSCAQFADCSSSLLPSFHGGWIYCILFIVFGIGGSVVSAVGCIQAYNYAKGRLLLSLIGFLCQIGCVIAQILMAVEVQIEIFFFPTTCSVIALALLLIETVFAAAKKPEAP